MEGKKTVKSVGIVVKPNHAEARATAVELSDWFKPGVSGLSANRSKQTHGRAFRPDRVGAGRPETMISTARLIGDADVHVLG